MAPRPGHPNPDIAMYCGIFCGYDIQREILSLRDLSIAIKYCHGGGKDVESPGLQFIKSPMQRSTAATIEERIRREPLLAEIFNPWLAVDVNDKDAFLAATEHMIEFAVPLEKEQNKNGEPTEEYSTALRRWRELHPIKRTLREEEIYRVSKERHIQRQKEKEIWEAQNRKTKEEQHAKALLSAQEEPDQLAYVKPVADRSWGLHVITPAATSAATAINKAHLQGVIMQPRPISGTFTPTIAKDRTTAISTSDDSDSSGDDNIKITHAPKRMRRDTCLEDGNVDFTRAQKGFHDSTKRLVIFNTERDDPDKPGSKIPGQIVTNHYKKRVDWNDGASISRLNTWRRTIQKRSFPHLSIDTAPLRWLKSEKSIVLDLMKRPGRIDWTALASAYNKEVAGKVQRAGLGFIAVGNDIIFPRCHELWFDREAPTRSMEEIRSVAVRWPEFKKIIAAKEVIGSDFESSEGEHDNEEDEADDEDSAGDSSKESSRQIGTEEDSPELIQGGTLRLWSDGNPMKKKLKITLRLSPSDSGASSGKRKQRYYSPDEQEDGSDEDYSPIQKKKCRPT